MKQVLISKGKAFAADVPVPQIESNEILVRLQASCLSIGTEVSGLKRSAVPLWKRAVAQPEKVLTTLQMVSNQGLKKTMSVIEQKKESANPTGYSAAGIVVAIGNEVKNYSVGDRVACAGGQYANHAEYIRVSENLCVRIPDSVEFESASTVTLGAIALQGVRRAQPTLGETFVVVGLGVLGQMTVQILRANGCQVIGIDPDRSRIQTATSQGMEFGLHPEDSDLQSVARLTDGFGADGVIITAATPSDEVVSSAFKMCRKKGRVVLVGDVGLHLNRADFYVKEIDFLISTSYGPGRYDKKYEEEGLEYPIGYVRWTENRNMSEYLRLIASGRINVATMISARFPIEEATAAYEAVSGPSKPLIALLTYPEIQTEGQLSFSKNQNLKSEVTAGTGKISIAVIGAGGFARSSHLPNIQSLSNEFKLRAVVNRTGPSAKSAGEQFGADYISTDPAEVFADQSVNSVLIATRHHLHGSMALAALKAGKHVLVEKPLTLTPEELALIEDFYKDDKGPKPILLTGYNRRFSPYAVRMKEMLAGRSAPFIFNYKMNAGYIPADHWVHSKEGGGRNLGEACHIYDLFTFLADSEVVEVSAHAIKPSSGHYSRNDNFVATMSFADGSVANLIYTALGNKEHAKETAELYFDGKVAILDDYKSLDVVGGEKFSLKTRIQDKGHMNELVSFGQGVRTGKWPIPLWQQLQVSRISFIIENMIFGR